MEDYRFNAEGYDRDGFDRDGYNREGYDRDGYSRDGYDCEGYDRVGYDWNGYDRYNCSYGDSTIPSTIDSQNLPNRLVINGVTYIKQ